MRPDKIPEVILLLSSQQSLPFTFSSQTHTVWVAVDEVPGQQTLTLLRSLYSDFVSWHMYFNHLHVLSLSLF